jgi:hypothetical protein
LTSEEENEKEVRSSPAAADRNPKDKEWEVGEQTEGRMMPRCVM